MHPQTLFEVKPSVEPQRDQVVVTMNQPAHLLYTITNITEPPPKETQLGTTPPTGEVTPTSTSPSGECRLGYEVCVDLGVWSLQEEGQGVMNMPAPGQSEELHLHVVPCSSGPLPIPPLLLKWLPEEGVAGCVLTPAQVYDVYPRGEVVTVSMPAAREEGLSPANQRN